MRQVKSGKMSFCFRSHVTKTLNKFKRVLFLSDGRALFSLLSCWYIVNRLAFSFFLLAFVITDLPRTKLVFVRGFITDVRL